MGSCHPMQYVSHENAWSRFVPDDETMENRYKNKEAKKYSAKDIMTMIFLDKSIESAFHICLQNITFLTDFYIKINSFSLHCAIIT